MASRPFSTNGNENEILLKKELAPIIIYPGIIEMTDSVKNFDCTL
jgi:hypothetical protein